MSQQINLFNPIFLKQKKHFSAVAMLQGLALIVVGAIMVAVYARAQLSGIVSEAAATKQRLKTTSAQLAKVTAQFAPRDKSKLLEGQVASLEADLKMQREILKVAREGNFDKNRGYSEYFRALARQIVEGLWLTGFSLKGAGTSIELRGRAVRPELVPEYINRLKREPVMAGKSFAALQMNLPLVDAPASTGNPSATASKRAADYVEFTLQSTETEADRETAGMSGVAAGAGAVPGALKLMGSR